MDEKKRKTVETYEKSAVALAKKFDDLGARASDIEKIFSFTQIKNPKVLELGCGNGRDAVEILKYTDKYLGIDISRVFIEMARRKVPSGLFAVADIDEYPFADSYDVIIAFASLLHSNKEAVARVLKKAGQSLNKEGVFYISLKHGAYKEDTRQTEFGERTYYYYMPEDMKRMMGDGFKIIFQYVYEMRGQEWFDICFRKE